MHSVSFHWFQWDSSGPASVVFMCCVFMTPKIKVTYLLTSNQIIQLKSIPSQVNQGGVLIFITSPKKNDRKSFPGFFLIGMHGGMALVSRISSLFMPWLDVCMGLVIYCDFSFHEAAGMEGSVRGCSVALDSVVFFLAFSLSVNEEIICIQP